jgi:hypothetical protein
MGEGEEIGDPVVDKPRWNRSWYQPFLVAKLVPALQSAWRVIPTELRLSRCSSVKTWWKMDVLSK